jgi:hypothetical protein
VCVCGHAHDIVVLLGYMFMLESCWQGGRLRVYVYVRYVCMYGHAHDNVLLEHDIYMLKSCKQ